MHHHTPPATLYASQRHQLTAPSHIIHCQQCVALAASQFTVSCFDCMCSGKGSRLWNWSF